MGGGTISTSETKIESLRLQSSTYGAALSVVYGVTRVPGNMLWYDGFKATPHTTTQRAGKGGGTKTKSTTYTYSAHVAMAVAEGPIIGIPRVWRGKKQISGGFTAAQILNATHSYTVAGGGGSVTVTNSATWTNTVAVFYTATIDQGDGTTTGPVYLAEGTDYTVAGGVYTFGSAWAGVALSIQYQYLSGGSETGLASVGLTKFSGKVGQGTWSLLTSSYPSAAVPYSGIAYVAAADYDLGSDATVENHNFEVQGPLAYHLGSTVADVDPALVAVDVLTNARYGAQFPAARLNVGLWSRYCRAAGLLLSPALTEQTSAAEVLTKLGMLTNTAPVWSAGALKMVPYGDAALTGNGATYTPYTTALYDLDDSELLPGSGGGEPVIMSYKPRSDAWNHVRIEYMDRSADYNVAVAEAKDQADIDAFGIRSSDVIQAHWINDGTVARAVAQLILQRALYVRATYKFRLPWTFALLEPMDLVTLTDAGLGLSLAPVRILSIDEGDDGTLDIEAEEYPSGISATALYPSQGGAGFNANYNAAPGNVSAPVIFEAPAELTTTGLEVYAAVTGVGSNWGGCTVWVSLDGATYSQAGVLYGGSRYGTITGPVSAGSLPVSILTGQLVAASAADAAALSSLCYVGGATPEYLAHQGATLTGAGAYTLGGLVRAAYGTSSASAHTTGDAFVRVDDGIGKSGPLALSMVGKTIYFKFTSFNIYGGSEQALADVSAYSYAITGYMAQRGTARPKLVTLTADRQTVTYDGTGALAPATQTTTFTITGQNLTSGTFTVSLTDATGTTLNANTYLTGSGTVTPSGNTFTQTGTTFTLTAAAFTTARGSTAGLIVTVTHADGVSAKAQVTKVQDGSPGGPGNPGDPGVSAISLVMTNEATSLVAYANGTVTSYSTAVGQAKVYSGATDVTATATLSASASSGVTAELNTATGSPVAGQPKGYYRVTAMSVDTGTVTVTAVYGGVTLVKVFSVSKSYVGYEIVATLPATNLFAGRVVFLTTDSKLYRYNGTAWTAAVPTADLSGTLTGAQIGDAQLTTAKFAAGLTPVEIVATLPTTGNFDGRVVFLTTDKKLYRYSATLTAFTKAVDGADITANSIVAGQITAGAIGTTQLAAGSVRADKLLVGPAGAALNFDPAMSDSSAWTAFSGAATFATVTDGKVGNTVARSASAGTQAWMNEAKRVPVDPAKTYRVRAFMRTVSGATSTAYMGVALYDAAGANIAGDGSQWLYAASAVTPPATFTEYVGYFGANTAKTIPATARVMTPLFILSYGGGTAIHEIQDLRIEEVLPSTLIQDGAISTAKLAANAVTASQIAANAVTADKILAGAVTAAKISVTDLSSLSANIGTLTAGTIQNSGATFKIDATNGRSITQNGSFMKVAGAPFGSTGQFLEWYGPYFAALTSCTEANAVYYLKTDGSAYFGGSLGAGILKNAAQTTSVIATAEVIVGPFTTNGGTKTIVLSYDYKYRYNCNASTGGITGTGSATVVIERSFDGTTWTQIGTTTLTGSGNVIVDGDPLVKDTVNWANSGSITVTDTSAASSTMRLRGRITARTLPTFNGTSKINIIETQTVGVISTE